MNAIPSWCRPEAPRLWRLTDSDFSGDETANAARVYADARLARIAEEGFTGVWLGARLYELMDSAVFPELNVPGRQARLDSLNALGERARRFGLGVYLYFNDPAGLDTDHPFWRAHPGLRGSSKWHLHALCTSAPEVQAFLRQAVGSAMAGLPGLAGVVLITACENLTHCWSKIRRRQGAPPPECPRCREREPADLVIELLDVWAAARRAHPRPFRLWAWNWEWAQWYEDPQREIVGRLPDGVELLLDLEFGGHKTWRGRDMPIGEYALSYVGPSDRLVATQDAVAGRGIPTHAKVQINTTHELCTVPNLPLLATLHGKLRALCERRIDGFMGCWSIGTQFTLNTFAVRLFLRSPQPYFDEEVFLRDLAAEYLGITDGAELVLTAWRGFSEAFKAYPFSVPMLYRGPQNDAPGRVLSLDFEGRPIGRSFMPDEPGDDLTPCLEGFDLDDVVAAFAAIRDGWLAVLPGYLAALDGRRGRVTDAQRRHRIEEASCARMLGHQFRSIVNVFAFYREQRRQMGELGLRPPCRLPPGPGLLAILADEIANTEAALPVVEADPRLGFHEEFHGHKYDATALRAKLVRLRGELGLGELPAV
ncbi:MAG: hypothetical protein BWZ02_02272 [Lentisphaerae bacterium ADurb.BinA184]|nr:MAG: hypothetical protein BWZ02_02272 [Lentisphaerae bacterium ADurb.BinA184]